MLWTPSCVIKMMLYYETIMLLWPPCVFEKCEAMRKGITFRRVRNIVLDDFRSDITTIDHLNDTSVDLNAMTVNFNKYLISLLNKHAPVCRKYMCGETKTLWYNNTILTAKQYKRQLEGRWRKLQTDKSRQA